MLSISYAWTIAAMKAREKFCTRRHWTPEYAARFHAGDKVLMLTRNYRIGGSPFGIHQLTLDPFQQPTGEMTEQDYQDEGLLWMELNGLSIIGTPPRQFFEEWRANNETVFVVRFNILEIF